MVLKLIEKYSRSTLALALAALEPLGVLIGAVGLMLAAIGLVLTFGEIKASRIERTKTLKEMKENRLLREETLKEMKENRLLREETLVEIEAGRVTREATLYGLLMERIQAAREAEIERGSRIKTQPTAVYGYDGHPGDCASDYTQVSVRAGQIKSLEGLVGLGLPLYGMDASHVSLGSRSTAQCELEHRTKLSGGKLANVNLTGTNLRCADLSDANLTDANLSWSCLDSATLRGALLGRTDLSYAVLTGADLSQVDMSDANLAKANFIDASGLTQGQLDSACADPVSAPVYPIVA